MAPWAQKNILVVEDDYFIAQDTVDALEEGGAHVLGPAPDIEQAMEYLNGDDRIDAAILDVNLNGHPVFPLADVLMSAGVPFVFASGGEPSGFPDHFAQVSKFMKPVDLVAIELALFP